jgi:hypothetical protein
LQDALAEAFTLTTKQVDACISDGLEAAALPDAAALPEAFTLTTNPPPNGALDLGMEKSRAAMEFKSTI